LNPQKTKSLAALHGSIALFGFAGLFGRMPLHPVLIVLGRVFFASVFLGSFLACMRTPAVKNRRTLLVMAGTGVLLGFHWLMFFHAIHISSVSVGLISFSTFPVFVVFLEPLFFHTKIQKTYIAAAAAVSAAVILIVPEYNFSHAVFRGVFWGVLSGVSFAVITLINRTWVQRTNPVFMALIQDVCACIVLIPLGVPLIHQLNIRMVLFLILLGVVFTGAAHTLFIYGLRHTNAVKAGIFASLEPVYGCLAAFVLLHEVPDLRVIAGGCIIIAVSVYIAVLRSAVK